MTKRIRRVTRHIWLDEHKDFVIKHNAGKSAQEVAELFNKEFNLSIEESQIKGLRARLGLISGITGHFPKGNKSWNAGKKQTEYMTEEQIKRTSVTRFKKGQIPPNWQPIGTERINSYGYVDVKVSDEGLSQNRWKLKAKIVWEEEHGDIPEGMVFRYLDGNSLNVTLNNLVLISRKQNAIINKNGLYSTDPEINKTSIFLSEVMVKANEKRKKDNEK